MTSTVSTDKVRAFESIRHFDISTEVLVCGYGGAGAAAALEAATLGAQVTILERASAGGGSTALSSCEMYLGGSGGTALQQALGLTDSTENMLAYLREALGPYGDEDKMQCYAHGAAAHFDWVESLGVPYKRAAFLERTVVPLSDESLLFTGNEKAHPFNSVATPVPRGHVPSSVIITTGGFVMNDTMTRQYMPELREYCMPYGNTFDLGDGIQLGQAVGGQTINMEQAFMSFPLYPPAKLTYGILLNKYGQRYINEDAYLARLAHYSCQQAEQKFYLLVQEEDYEASHYLQRAAIIATGDSIAEVASEAPFPAGMLEQTVCYFNQHAIDKHDPLFHKSAEWLKPLTKPPFALLEYSAREMGAIITPGTKGPLIFTLGGLKTRTTGEVINLNDEVISGLYAAGRATAGLPRTAKGYASGMSVGDATFFGRLAGRSAAQHQPL
jgi:3-oxo-5alpha-steroid 4-dehydrogenase